MSFLYTEDIKKMMYVYGDFRHASSSSAQYIERVVCAHLVSLVEQCNRIRVIRKGAFINIHDMYLVLNQKKKIQRIKKYIKYKKLKKCKENLDDECITEEEKENNDNHIIDSMGYSDNNIMDNLDMDDMDNLNIHNMNDNVDNLNMNDINDTVDNDTDSTTYTNVDDRLGYINDITKDMSVSEYLDFCECRQASFSSKKIKVFKKFINLKYKVVEEVIDSLSLLANDLVYDIIYNCSKIILPIPKEEIRRVVEMFLLEGRITNSFYGWNIA